MINTVATLPTTKTKRIFLTEQLLKHKYLKKWIKVLVLDKGKEFLEYATELDATLPKEVRLILKRKWEYDLVLDIGVEVINRAIGKAGLKPIEVPLEESSIPKKQLTLPDSSEDHLEIWDHPNKDAPIQMVMGRIVIDGLPRADIHLLASNTITIMQKFKKLGLPCYFIEG